MLTDSKVRQAGFIRNSSSRKILYNPEPEKNRSDDSDDSFSSFQYQSGRYSEIEKSRDVKKSVEKRQQQVITKVMKPQSPHIPPRPSKRVQQKPQFQNQRLKNNFFQQPLQHQKSRQKPQQSPLPFTLPRSYPPPPRFQQQAHFKQQIEQVQNICNRIGNMKVLEGNFSFNPKTSKLMKKELEGEGYLLRQQKEMIMKEEKKPKMNSYFNDRQQKEGSKFQYDFQSSEEENGGQNQEGQSECRSESEEEDNEMVQHYLEEQRKTLPQSVNRTQPRSNFPHANTQAYSQGQIHHHQQQQSHPNQKFQNQESQDQQQQQEELITDYNKTDFGLSMPEQLKRDKQTEHSRQHNLAQQQGVIQKHGGISFQVDVKQFSHTPSGVSYQQTRRPPHQRKKKVVNQKDELLKRRQMAKIYSKQARFRLFGFS